MPRLILGTNNPTTTVTPTVIAIGRGGTKLILGMSLHPGTPSLVEIDGDTHAESYVTSSGLCGTKSGKTVPACRAGYSFCPEPAIATPAAVASIRTGRLASRCKNPLVRPHLSSRDREPSSKVSQTVAGLADGSGLNDCCTRLASVAEFARGAKLALPRLLKFSKLRPGLFLSRSIGGQGCRGSCEKVWCWSPWRRSCF